MEFRELRRSWIWRLPRNLCTGATEYPKCGGRWWRGTALLREHDLALGGPGKEGGWGASSRFQCHNWKGKICSYWKSHLANRKTGNESHRTCVTCCLRPVLEVAGLAVGAWNPVFPLEQGGRSDPSHTERVGRQPLAFETLK